MIARDPVPATASLVRMAGITKRFGSVTVLENVDFTIRPGEVHILAGENGAGKSTLIKILAGVYTDYAGRVTLHGQVVRPAGPQEAARRGIAVIHQELSLVPSMTVADNIFMGRIATTTGGLVRARFQRAEASRLLRQFGLRVGPDQYVEQLPVAAQQLVEIVKALSQDARVIVMDEPTSALNAPEVEKLFHLIAQLRSEGRGIVYITHKMEEIERIADHVTVLRDGHLIGSGPKPQVPVAKLIHWMVGRQLDQQYVRKDRYQGRPRLIVEDFNVKRGAKTVVDRVDLTVHAGEIVGLAGLQGSGNSHLLMGLFGAYGNAAAGHIIIDTRNLRPNSPRRSIRRGMALLTNDRKANGLVLPLSIVANTTLAQLDRFSTAGWMRQKMEWLAAEQLAQSLSLRAAALDMEVGELSGGNQQKVALAKWILSQPGVLLLDEPTRGVDVGAKREIYELMQQWAAQGIAILLVTSEMPELLALSDRIVVMHRGRVTARFAHQQATADAVLKAAMGKKIKNKK